MCTRRGGRHRNDEQQEFQNTGTSDLEYEVQLMFEKKFRFEAPAGEIWTLPKLELLFSEPPETIDVLQVEKQRLNWHKSQLNDMRIEEWSEHTRRRNPAGDVLNQLRRHTHPEFLTQAWTKFYECLCTFNVVPVPASASGRLVSLHLCEAPGAFVAALNHYLHLHHMEIQWSWTASTLNPYYEGNVAGCMISDDRLMLHTLPRWCFGADHTGDLLRLENAQHTVRTVQEDGEVLLVTADGSIDCTSRPDAQEEVTSALHYCEAVTALLALARGGTFICKVFTLLEHSTISLLYLLRCLFTQLDVFKPVTSRPGNSEVYLVCTEYAGPDALAPYVSALESGFGTELYNERALLPLRTIPQSFLDQAVECARFFSSWQCTTINSNLEAYLQRRTWDQRVRNIQTLVAARFLKTYDVRPISAESRLAPDLGPHRTDVNTHPRHHRGSYTQRHSFGKMAAAERVTLLQTELQAMQVDWSALPSDGIEWHQEPKHPSELTFVSGKRLTTLCSSKFVYAPLLALYRRASEEWGSAGGGDEPGGRDECLLFVDSSCEKIEFPAADLARYGEHVISSITLVERILEKVPIGGSLQLRNVDALSHLSAGVLHLLARSFKEIGFTIGTVVLRGRESQGELEAALASVRAEAELSERAGRSLLAVLPLAYTDRGGLFAAIVKYNTRLYAARTSSMLHVLQARLAIRLVRDVQNARTFTCTSSCTGKEPDGAGTT